MDIFAAFKGWFLGLSGSSQLMAIVLAYGSVIVAIAIRDLYFPDFRLRWQRKRTDGSENQMRGLGL